MDIKYKGPERRKHKRLKVNFLVIYSVRKPIDVIMIVGSQVKTAMMLDLSESGMAIVTNYDIPISTILEIKFTLINTHAHDEDRIKTIEIIGQVRYNVQAEKDVHRLGIYFTQITEEDRSAIARFVNLAIE